jgi:hypothetical protein
MIFYMRLFIKSRVKRAAIFSLEELRHIGVMGGG